MADGFALLRIYTSERETWQGKSLHSALLEAARDRDLAGATVLRGVEGFGADQRIHRAGLVDFSPDLPMLVEIVDQEAALRAFASACAAMIGERLVTLQRIERLTSDAS